MNKKLIAAILCSLSIAFLAAQYGGDKSNTIPASGGGGSFTLHNTSVAQLQNANGPATASFTGTTAIGDLLIGVASCYSATAGRCTTYGLFTDSQSNTWPTPTNAATASNAYAMIAVATVASGKTGTNPSCSYGGASVAAYWTVQCFWVHWSGTTLTGGTPSGNNGTSGTYTSGSVTTTSANSFFVGGCTTDNGNASTSYNNSFAKVSETLTGQPLYVGDRSAGAVTTTLSISSTSDSFACVVVTAQGT